jgi:uncharacterized protein YjaG (DUF416 family)
MFRFMRPPSQFLASDAGAVKATRVQYESVLGETCLDNMIKVSLDICMSTIDIVSSAKNIRKGTVDMDNVVGQQGVQWHVLPDLQDCKRRTWDFHHLVRNPRINRRRR